ncbi:MAG TPA: DNA recombination protein RmuC [Burkholderiales bacterium]|nr:DNA recombination protein RmuC [Burkholderiales bacterium]
MEIAIAAFLLLGLVLGTAAGWFFRSSRASQSEEMLREARTRLEQVDKERVAALDELRVESSRRASFEALSQRIPDLEQSLQYREQTILRYQQTILEAAREKEALAATIEAERKAFEEKQRLLEEAKAALSDAFGALSANALKSNSEQFVKLANASVAPVREALEKFEDKVQALEVAREGAYQGLVQQVTQLLDTGKELRSETANLVQALRAPVTRGQWGEFQLRRVIEMAGMVNHCHFFEQKKVDTEDGQLRPDVVVKLPAGKTIVIDAKAPVSSYMDAVVIEDETERRAKLANFAKLVREHIAALGRKAYWDQFEASPELVVMFMPGDHYYSAALEQDPSLIEFGVEQKVLVATPVNLIGLLRAIAFGWRQEAIATNATEISQLGAELYKRISDLGGHWVDVGKSLNKAVEAFNSTVGTLETRVLVSARRFKDLGAAPASLDIDVIEPVVKAARSLKVLDIGTAKDA